MDKMDKTLKVTSRYKTKNKKSNVMFWNACNTTTYRCVLYLVCNAAAAIDYYRDGLA